MERFKFPEMVALCDGLKTCWYQLKYISERRSKYGSLSSTARMALDELDRNLCAISTLMRSSGNVHVKLEQLKELPDFEGPITYQCKRPLLRMAAADIMEASRHSDSPFYAEAGYGNYWNEVPLPHCIKAVFTAYVDLTKHLYPGMLGVEAPGMNIPEDAAAISYYDLSDLAVVFQDEDSLALFNEENAVDPSDTMYRVGNDWIC